jgi:hypothetical protein
MPTTSISQSTTSQRIRKETALLVFSFYPVYIFLGLVKLPDIFIPASVAKPSRVEHEAGSHFQILVSW